MTYKYTKTENIEAVTVTTTLEVNSYQELVDLYQMLVVRYEADSKPAKLDEKTLKNLFKAVDPVGKQTPGKLPQEILDKLEDKADLRWLDAAMEVDGNHTMDILAKSNLKGDV
jgi:hypothetical protein